MDQLELVEVPAVVPAAPAGIELRLGVVVGDLQLRASPLCRVAILEYVRVDPPYRRRGLAIVAVQAALAWYPGYQWSTSAIDDTEDARGFWAAIDWPGRLGEPEECRHMRTVDQLSP